MRRTIAVDFDNTLVLRDVLLPGAKEAMQQLRAQGDYILIYSCNNPKWIERVLNMHDVPYDEIYGKEGGKPVCDYYIDDRNISFDGDWSKALGELEILDGRRRKTKEPGVI